MDGPIPMTADPTVTADPTPADLRMAAKHPSNFADVPALLRWAAAEIERLRARLNDRWPCVVCGYRPADHPSAEGVSEDGLDEFRPAPPDARPRSADIVNAQQRSQEKPWERPGCPRPHVDLAPRPPTQRRSWSGSRAVSPDK
jgi:hypothetical protein